MEEPREMVPRARQAVPSRLRIARIKRPRVRRLEPRERMLRGEVSFAGTRGLWSWVCGCVRAWVRARRVDRRRGTAVGLSSTSRSEKLVELEGSVGSFVRS